MFGFFGCEADGILAHLPATEPTLEGEVLLDCQGSPSNWLCLVPAYEDHCRQTILSSFQNKEDFEGAVKC